MIGVVVPVLNEPGIADFLRALCSDLHQISEGYEVIVVMGDRETLFPPIPQLPNLSVVTSYGDSLERAILTGFTVARGNKVIVMDGDGSHDPGDIPRMVRELDAHEMVVGSRLLEGSIFQQSSFRRLVSRMFIRWARMNGSRQTDPMSGFFGVRKDLLKRVRFKPFKWKISLEIELKAKPDVVEIPIRFSRRTAGASKSTLKTGLEILWDVLWR